MSGSNHADGSTPPGLTCFPASQELAAARNHAFPKEIAYGYVHSWHTSKIVDFEAYAMAVKKLKETVYLTVTCSPATQACDIRYLVGRGFFLETLQPVNMFPQTKHIEIIALLTR